MIIREVIMSLRVVSNLGNQDTRDKYCLARSVCTIIVITIACSKWTASGSV